MLTASEALPGISHLADGEAGARGVMPVEAHRLIAT